MKKLLLAAAALSGLTAAAQAADMSVPAYDWSGFYVGLNAGAGFNNSELENNFDYTGPGFVPRPTSAQINDAIDDFDGNVGSDEAVFTGGAMIGYNYQMESLLLGVEADINYAGFGNDRSRDFSNISQDFIVGDNVSGNSDLSFDANWFGTLRGRLGFAADNLLFYGTAGLAYGHMEASAQLNLVDDGGERVSYDTSTDSTNWGWTAGAGMEYGLDNWSFGLEYLYVDLGSAEWDGNLAETVNDANISTALSDIEGSGNVDYQFSVVRATAKLRF